MLTYEYKLDGTKRQYAAIDEAIRIVQFIELRRGDPCLQAWGGNSACAAHFHACLLS
jgi:putative transposase